jgi:hypothetical protein
MADAPRSSWGAFVDTPQRHVGRAGLNDLVLMLPLVVLAVVGGVLVGRVVALPLLVAAVLIRPAMIVATGSTPGLRRQRIRVIQAGDRSPAWWRPFLWHVAPFLLLAPIWLLAGSPLWPLGFVPYVAFYGVAWWRARARGPGTDPLLAMAGLDVAWAGEPPTPSGTSERPAPAPAPPTSPARARPGQARPPGRRGRR